MHTMSLGSQHEFVFCVTASALVGRAVGRDLELLPSAEIRFIDRIEFR